MSGNPWSKNPWTGDRVRNPWAEIQWVKFHGSPLTTKLGAWKNMFCVVRFDRNWIDKIHAVDIGSCGLVGWWAGGLVGSLQPPTRAPPPQHRHLPPSPPARVSSRVGLARVGMGLGGHPRPPKNKGEGVPPSPFSAVVRGGVVDYSVTRHIKVKLKLEKFPFSAWQLVVESALLWILMWW